MAACTGPGLGRQARRPRGRRGRGGRRARRQRRRHRRDALRDRLRRKSEEFVSLVDEIAAESAPRARSHRAVPGADRDDCSRPQGEHLDRSRRTASWPARAKWSTPTSTSRPGAASTPWSSWCKGGDEELAHDVAVHIAFAKPLYLTREDVPADEVAAERETVEEISRNEGKPEAALPKIIEGRLNGWFKERVLLEQPYAKDEKQTIAQFLGGATIVALRPSGDRELGESRCAASCLKLSGEALASAASDETIDATTVDFLGPRDCQRHGRGGLELAVVVGGGNIWRGATGAMAGMNRANRDHMGMLGTVINALALQDAIESTGSPTRVHVGHRHGPGRRALHPPPRRPPPREGPGGHLRRRHGQPVLHHRHPGRPARRRDRGRQCVLKGTHGGVDGVYAEDPRVNADGHPVRRRSPSTRSSRSDLRVMDMTAITFCKDNHLPLRVFDLMAEGNLGRALDGRRRRYAGAVMDNELVELVIAEAAERMADAVEHVQERVRARCAPAAPRRRSSRTCWSTTTAPRPRCASWPNSRCPSRACWWSRPSTRAPIGRDREGHRQRRPRAQPLQRRQRHPPRFPTLTEERRKDVRQGRARQGRGGQGGAARGPPPRPPGAREPREGQGPLQRRDRAAGEGPRQDDPGRGGRRSTRCSRTRSRNFLRSDDDDRTSRPARCRS